MELKTNHSKPDIKTITATIADIIKGDTANDFSGKYVSVRDFSLISVYRIDQRGEKNSLLQFKAAQVIVAEEPGSGDFNFSIKSLNPNELNFMGGEMNDATVSIDKNQLKIVMPNKEGVSVIQLDFDSQTIFAIGQSRGESEQLFSQIKIPNASREVVLVPTVNIVLSVVKRFNSEKNDYEFLFIQESLKKNDGGLWYLPAGRAKAQEDMLTAVKRETREEAGVEISIKGLLTLQQGYSVNRGSAKIRYAFIAEQDGSSQPKSIADQESERADWFTLDEIKNLPLRGRDVIELCKRSLSGQYLPVEYIDLFSQN